MNRIARYVEPEPKGFLGIFSARHGFVYAFEKRRMRLRKEGRRQRIGTWGAAVFYALSALYVAGVILADGVLFGYYADPILSIIAGVILVLMPIGSVLGSPSAGARAFAGERANGTIDALVMTPLGRYELVAGRFLAHLRSYFFLFFVFTASLAFMFLAVAAEGYPDLDEFLIGCAGFGTAAFFYLSALTLGAALGLHFSLRFESAAGALIVSLGLFIAIGLLEWVGSLFLMGVLVAVTTFGRRMGPGGEMFFTLIWFAIPIAFAVVHVIVASSLVSHAAQRFDAWGRGKWG